MPLFEVAIVKKPTKKETEDGSVEETLLLGPKFVMARDAQTAAIKAVMADDSPKGIDLSRAEVQIRPFV